MSSPENLNQDQFKDHLRLYRGVNTPDYEGGVEDPRLTSSVGVHWTPSLESAKRFAAGLHPDEDAYLHASDESTAKGHVIEALVPRDSVNYEPDKYYDIGNHQTEKEVPLLHNAPIFITGVHQVEYNEDEGKIRIRKKSLPTMASRS